MFGGWPELVTAIFQAQKGCISDLARGQAAVAHCNLPRALSTDLAVNDEDDEFRGRNLYARDVGVHHKARC